MVRVPYWRAAFSIGHDLLDFFDPGKHGAELNEFGASHAGDDFCQRSLAGARRSPEDERSDVVALDLRAQRFAGRNEVLLPDIFIERARTHAVGKRATLHRRGYCCREWFGKGS